MQKVSKKENTTKIFLKLSFFGNISVCVVAVKAVYWGPGPVSGVSCCDSLGSTSRRAAAAAASDQLSSRLRTAFEIYRMPHKFPAKLEKDRTTSFRTTLYCWNVSFRFKISFEMSCAVGPFEAWISSVLWPIIKTHLWSVLLRSIARSSVRLTMGYNLGIGNTVTMKSPSCRRFRAFLFLLLNT